MQDVVDQLAGNWIVILIKREKHLRSWRVTEKIQKYNKKYYDARHRTPTVYQVGDYVLVSDLQDKPGVSRKFKPN